MSFLGNIVTSIGDGNAPPPLPALPSKPTNTNALRANSTTTKPTSRPSTPVQSSGVKRKVEDSATASNPPPVKTVVPTQSSSAVRRPAAPPLNAPRLSADKALVPRIQTDKLAKTAPSKPSPISSTAPSKPPLQGKIGVVTHQKAAPKDKLSKRAEQKKAEEEKIRKSKSGNGGIRKPESRRSASPVKNGVKEGRVSKAGAKSGYKGTMGLSAGRNRPRQEKKSRYDSYLGTDEEDNSDVEEEEDYDEEGYESSDMEGGFDDLEQEESIALRKAKADDAKELAYENQLKREKDERRRKLMSLAKKQR